MKNISPLQNAFLMRQVSGPDAGGKYSEVKNK